MKIESFWHYESSNHRLLHLYAFNSAITRKITRLTPNALVLLNRAEKIESRGGGRDDLNARLYPRAHNETTRQLCTDVRVHAPPDLGFRIHLTRAIDHECTSDRADLLKKSSYLHSPRIVGFRIKRGLAPLPPFCRRFPRRGQVRRTNLLEMPCTRWLRRIAATFDETREFIRKGRWRFPCKKICTDRI